MLWVFQQLIGESVTWSFFQSTGFMFHIADVLVGVHYSCFIGCLGFLLCECRVYFQKPHSDAQPQRIGKASPLFYVTIEVKVILRCYGCRVQLGGSFTQFFQKIHVDIFLFVILRFYNIFLIDFTCFKVGNVTVIIGQFQESLYFQDTTDSVQIGLFRVVGGLIYQGDSSFDNFRIVNCPKAFHVIDAFFTFASIFLHTPAANPVVDKRSRKNHIAEGTL